MAQALAYFSLNELDKIVKRYEENMKKAKGCARNKNPNVEVRLRNETKNMGNME